MRFLAIGLLGSLLASAVVTPAAAQSDSVMVPGVGVMTSAQIEERIGTLEKQRDSVNLAGPRAGVGITTILIPGGAFMTGAGAAMRSFDPSPDTGVMIAAGVATIIGGLVGVVMTSRKLGRRKAARARLEREIDRLERALPSESL
jgi:hypothetical protein